MNRREKLSYFKDYYLLPCIGIVSVTAVVLFLLWSIVFRPREQTVLHVAVLDCVLGQEQMEGLMQELDGLFSITDKKRQILINDSFNMKEDGLAKLEVYLSNGQLDVVIAEKEMFKTLSGYGFFQNLETVLPGREMQELKSDLFLAAGYLEHEENGFEDKETGRGEVMPYGICLPPGCIWMGAAPDAAEPVCGIAEGAENLENAISFLSFIRSSK